MKKLITFYLVLSMVLLNSLVCVAQREDPCNQLRNDIQRLEQMDITKLAPSIREIYKESLLKLYRQFGDCLDRELAMSTDTQVRVKGTAAAHAAEARTSSLRAEKAELERKTLILEIASNLKGGLTNSNVGPERSALSNSPAVEPAATASSTSATPSVPVANGNSTPAAESASSTTPAVTAAVQPTPAAEPVAPQVDDACKDVIAGTTYPDPPAILSALVNREAFDVVNGSDPDFAVASLTQTVLYTIFDAASPTSSKMLRGLEAYEYLGETARTDKQLGATPNSEAAVSAIEKPSFAQLLGFAIDHGGITKKNDGTNLTLSTSLYSLYAMTEGDTAETYQKAGFLNRIGVAATFAVDNNTNELANARRNNLSEWSAKVRLFGDRSTRSARFQRFWDQNVRPLIRKRLLSLGESVRAMSTQLKPYNRIERLSSQCLPGLVSDRMKQADYTSATATDKQAIIAAFILSHLRANIFNQVEQQGGRLQLNPEQIAQIETDLLPHLKSALDNLVKADAEVKKQLDDLSKGPLATFAYTNFRIPNGSDYSETKFLFEQDKGLFRPLKLVGNFGLSFYNKPDPLLNQKRLRDIFGALSFEGSSKSPFTEAENQSRITYAFVGSYQRLFENRRLAERQPDIAAFQFVMEIPFFKGLSLPLSATYANATEEERKNHFRFNFGMRLDTDKLFELLRAASNR